VRRADAALNEMSPREGAGRRVSVEIYEVLLDEAFLRLPVAATRP
jgi:hypothetical protein